MWARPEPHLVNHCLSVQICDLKFIQNKHATSVIETPLRWLPRWSACQKYLDQSETQMCHNTETRSIWNAQASPRQQAPPVGKKSQRVDLAIGKNNKKILYYLFQKDFAPSSPSPQKNAKLETEIAWSKMNKWRWCSSHAKEMPRTCDSQSLPASKMEDAFELPKFQDGR